MFNIKHRAVNIHPCTVKTYYINVELIKVFFITDLVEILEDSH